MSALDEINSPQSQINSALKDAIAVLGQAQIVSFRRYKRVVLPLDGFVFWLPIGDTSLEVVGSLHYSQDVIQSEDETYGQATVKFSTAQQVTEFTAAPVNLIYIADIRDPQDNTIFRYAFRHQNGFYDAAGIWHYYGQSIPPAMLTQLLDDPKSIDQTQAVTSNSLSLWLPLNNYSTPFYDDFTLMGVPFLEKAPILFPAFIADPNETAPYGTIHIPDAFPQSLQVEPYLDANRNSWQLGWDRVTITLYGLQNNAAVDFLNTVLQYSRLTNNFGIMNMPIVRDANRTMPEIQARAMKKVIDFEVSYYQTRVDNVARQLIKKAQMAFLFK